MTTSLVIYLIMRVLHIVSMLFGVMVLFFCLMVFEFTILPPLSPRSEADIVAKDPSQDKNLRNPIDFRREKIFVLINNFRDTERYVFLLLSSFCMS